MAAINALEGLDFTRIEYYKSGKGKGKFKCGMKKYHDVPVYFGTHSAFLVDFKYKNNGEMPTEHKHLTWETYVSAIKAKSLNLHDPEDTEGVILLREVDTVSGDCYMGDYAEKAKEAYGFTDEEIADIEDKVSKIASSLYVNEDVLV